MAVSRWTFGLLFAATLLGSSDASSANKALGNVGDAVASLGSSVWMKARRTLNLSSTFGTVTRAPPFERIMCQPVFQVTTAWGSPYMLYDENDIVKKSRSETAEKEQIEGISSSVEEESARQVSLYFMDEQDAMFLADEMKQMQNMEDVDLRITSTTLGKAIRNAAVLDGGMPSGQPFDAVSGKLTDDGSLRHKIVPSRAQLFYSCRCLGRERVGFFSDTAEEDAVLTLVPGAISGANYERREKKKNSVNKPPSEEELENPMRALNRHMEGYTGIPVFSSPNLVRKQPILKKLATCQALDKTEVPLFFNFQDLMEALKESAVKSNQREALGDAVVEVHNLWDVVTSMERERLAREQNSLLAKLKSNPMDALKELRDTVTGNKKTASAPSGLDRVTFVPSSTSVKFKRRITQGGNRKSRLRPMRKFP